jgi:hypothetical protein
MHYYPSIYASQDYSVQRVAFFQQLAVSAAANLGTTASGMTLGFSAVALPAMQGSHHIPRVSNVEANVVCNKQAQP